MTLCVLYLCPSCSPCWVEMAFRELNLKKKNLGGGTERQWSHLGAQLAISSLVVTIVMSTSATLLALLTEREYPLVVLLPALVVNMGFLHLHPIHGLLFSFIQIPW